MGRGLLRHPTRRGSSQWRVRRRQRWGGDHFVAVLLAMTDTSTSSRETQPKTPHKNPRRHKQLIYKTN